MTKEKQFSKSLYWNDSLEKCLKLTVYDYVQLLTTLHVTYLQ